MSALGEELQEEEEEAPWCGDREKVVFQLRNLNQGVQVFIVLLLWSLCWHTIQTQARPTSPHRDFINLSALEEDSKGPGDPGVPTNIITKYIRGNFLNKSFI